MNDHTKTFDLSRHRFEDTIPIEDAYKIPAPHAISVRADNGSPAFICKMAPPVKTQYDNSFLTKRHARMYGRSWHDYKGITRKMNRYAQRHIFYRHLSQHRLSNKS